MAQIFMEFEGQKGGTTDATGNYDDHFEVDSIDLGGSRNINDKTFEPTGSVVLDPVLVTMGHDKNIGSLYQAWQDGKTKGANVKFKWRTNETDNLLGMEVELENATISEMRTSLSDTAGSDVDVSTTMVLVYKTMKITGKDPEGKDGGVGEVKFKKT